MATIRIPHEYQPREYQRELLASPKRFKIAVWHRRGGKSKTVLNDQIRKTQLQKGVYYYFLPTYRQAKQVIFDSLVREHIPKEIVSKFNESELAVYYKNGSIQRFVGCEDIDAHRGINPIDVVFDEYSEMKEEIWTAIIRPVLAENGGTATFIFTPKGKNHAWKLIQNADDDWFVSIQPVSKTQAIDESELVGARREMPQALYAQEFECEFAENAGAVFRRVRNNVFDAVYNDQHSYNLGVDLAKYQDFTVIAPFDRNNGCVLPLTRFNQVDWNLQKARIEAEYYRHNDCLIRIDATGLGDPVYDDLVRRNINIEPYKFTEQSRAALLEHLAILLEQDRIKLPNDETLLTELEGFQYQMNDSTRKIKMTSVLPHDDCVFALALAVWGWSDKETLSLSWGHELTQENNLRNYAE